jgi:hypothetical protein
LPSPTTPPAAVAVFRPADAAGWALLASVTLYLAGLLSPVFPGYRGRDLLLSGWVALLSYHTLGPLLSAAWLANPLLLLAWLALMSAAWRAAALLGLLASVCAGGAFFGLRYFSAAGVALPLPSLRYGYWPWLASCLAALAAALIGLWQRRAAADS